MRLLVNGLKFGGIGLLVVAVWHWAWPESVEHEVLVLGIVGALAFAARMIYVAVRRARVFSDRAIILGTAPLAASVVDELNARPGSRFQVMGFVDDTGEGAEAVPGARYLGPIEQLSRIIDVTDPTRIVVAMRDRRGRVPDGPLLEARFRGIAVEEGVSFYERATGKLAIESMRPSSLILAEGFRHPDFASSRLRRAIRRAITCAWSSIALVLSSPVLGLIAALVKLDSAGPVFFVQDRVGRGGRPFPLIKFRTMRTQDGQKSEWVADNEQRITRVGKWLRRFRLDELPQLVNIVRGHMNLVGPRPHPVSNFQLFMAGIPYYGLRATVRPGVTGWAQVRYGYANSLEEETEKMRYDLYYIKQRTFWLDVRIVLQTVAVLFFSRGSHAAAPPVPRRALNEKKADSPAGAG